MSGYVYMFGGYNFKNVDVNFLDEVESIHLIDIRSEAEVAAGGIRGAKHIPMHLLPLRASEIPRDKPVVLYCRSGARSAQACAYLSGQGYNNLHNLHGGIIAWAQAGKRIESLYS